MEVFFGQQKLESKDDGCPNRGNIRGGKELATPILEKMGGRDYGPSCAIRGTGPRGGGLL